MALAGYLRLLVVGVTLVAGTTTGAAGATDFAQVLLAVDDLVGIKSILAQAVGQHRKTGAVGLAAFELQCDLFNASALLQPHGLKRCNAGFAIRAVLHGQAGGLAFDAQHGSALCVISPSD